MSGIRALEARLQGWPDEALTVGLVTAGLALIVIALMAPTLAKAAVLAWVVFP